MKSDGSLEWFKARLVAKGYKQQYGVDYQETFSAIVKIITVRCLIALAACRNWTIFQLDVNNAFLHGDLHEEVYIAIPEGLNTSPNVVCKLKKSLYGLKQSSRQWFARLTIELIYKGYTQSKNDYSLFIKKDHKYFTIVAVYVDDIIVTGDNISVMKSLKAHLHRIFSIKDLGELNYFLGCEVTTDLLKSSKIHTFKRVAIPLPLNLKLYSNDSPLIKDQIHYSSLIHKLNFLTNTRPDLSFTFQTLSQFMQRLTESHYKALLHTLNYVAGTSGQGILLKGIDSLQLKAYSDSVWRTCLDTIKIVTGYVILFGD